MAPRKKKAPGANAKTPGKKPGTAQGKKSAKKPATTGKPTPPSRRNSLPPNKDTQAAFEADEFDLTLDDSEVEVPLRDPSGSEQEVHLRSALPEPSSGSGDSGVKLGAPADSGISLEISDPDAVELIIDPFEHLVSVRTRRWSLDRSAFGREVERSVQLVRSDPDMALTKCRVTLERCLRQVHQQDLGEAGTKPLEQVIKDLARESGLPRKMRALAEAIRELGNVGAHPIMDDEDLSHREAQVAVLALILLLEWHLRKQRVAEAGAEYHI